MFCQDFEGGGQDGTLSGRDVGAQDYVTPSENQERHPSHS
jgi:hypothetical protein